MKTIGNQNAAHNAVKGFRAAVAAAKWFGRGQATALCCAAAALALAVVQIARQTRQNDPEAV
ncbi:MAG: hypothetical protein LBB67_02660 [Oscillospiraceae bacterium]|jgi:DNA-binding LacI/PurR family transcriptional regulator|nr:hypothetical protein [Oscillospiraceae bacterium]